MARRPIVISFAIPFVEVYETEDVSGIAPEPFKDDLYPSMLPVLAGIVSGDSAMAFL